MTTAKKTKTIKNVTIKLLDEGTDGYRITWYDFECYNDQLTQYADNMVHAEQYFDEACWRAENETDDEKRLRAHCSYVESLAFSGLDLLETHDRLREGLWETLSKLSLQDIYGLVKANILILDYGNQLHG